METEYDVFYFADDIKETLNIQEKDIFEDLLATKKNVIREYEIVNGGAKKLNKILIEDWAPTESQDDKIKLIKNKKAVNNMNDKNK